MAFLNVKAISFAESENSVNGEPQAKRGDDAGGLPLNDSNGRPQTEGGLR